jgi:hypothetical protein
MRSLLTGKAVQKQNSRCTKAEPVFPEATPVAIAAQFCGFPGNSWWLWVKHLVAASLSRNQINPMTKHVARKSKLFSHSSNRGIELGLVTWAEAACAHKFTSRPKIVHGLFSAARRLVSRPNVASWLLQSSSMMKIAFGFRWMALLLAIALLTTTTAQAANHYIRAGATGKGDGSNWTDAWPSLQAARPLVRGDTYYLATGTYAADTLSTPASGTTPITIKKAIGAIGQAGHGTDEGWVEATMGAGQAKITGEFVFNSSYWVIDGQKGAGFSVLPPDTNSANYGIAMTSGYRCFTIVPPAGNITISRVYGAQANNDTAAGSGFFVGSASGSGTVDNITVSRCLMVLWGQGITAQFNAWNNLVFEYNCYWTIYASSVAHANPINASYGDINNATVRYNLFYKNVPGSWGFSQVIAANNANWNSGKIYGNVFDHCWAGRSIISGNGRPNDAVYNLLVYNNTFLWSSKDYPNDGGGLIGDEYSGGNTFVNNLAYFCNASVSGAANDYNQYVATWKHPNEPHGVIITSAYDPFKNAANQDYRLKTNTLSGAVLPAEYGFDALGNPRTTWTRGAFEFRSTLSTNAELRVTPSSLDFGVIAAGASNDLRLTVQNVGGGLLSGAATVSTPFSILSGATYSLGSNQSQVVTIRYQPTQAGNQSQTIAFTGGGGGVASLSGAAYSVLPGASFPAGAGLISAPFVASGGVVEQSMESGVSDGGRAVYAFAITNTGDYVVQAVVDAPSAAENSFYVNIDAEPTDPQMVWHIPVTPGFQTALVSWQGNGTYDLPESAPKVFALQPGTHQLIVRGREPNTKLQFISIVKVVSPPSNLRQIALSP